MQSDHTHPYDFDYIIIGSGFGGAVCALRLTEKNYRVLILEKGKWFQQDDFPKTNWNLRKWMWRPLLRFFGFFKLTFFRNVTILSGVGVGGGSLVYAGAHPIPKKEFFEAPTWSHLADWEKELQKYYISAISMLGVQANPQLEIGDKALQKLAVEIGKEEHFEATNVAIFFGEPGKEYEDPYFNGEGPVRNGCELCGACMIGCPKNAKNSLDKNYLYLAQKKGAQIQAESEVTNVIPLHAKSGNDGYRIFYRFSTKLFSRKYSYTSQGVIFAGGVLGTVKLLLKLKKSSLPQISPMIGKRVRTNSESLIGVTTFDKQSEFCNGVAIGSILHTDRFSHIEPVRYPSGSGFWRILIAPMVHGRNIFIRIVKLIYDYFRHPIQNLRVILTRDFAKRTQILLYMRTIDSTLQFRKGPFGMKTVLEEGPSPSAFIPEAKTLAEQYARIINGKPSVLITETLLGRPTTAHILGGAVMGRDPSEGVIDVDNRLFGYKNMLVCDGSMISANPGVNPSLTIVALSERAMSKIEKKSKRS
jgi:cholesterol oxidase